MMRAFSFSVLLAGIEPASIPSEGTILSIERQELRVVLKHGPKNHAFEYFVDSIHCITYKEGSLNLFNIAGGEHGILRSAHCGH